MSGCVRSLGSGSLVLAIALLVVGSAPRRAEATATDDTHTGDVLQTLNLAGTAADCTPNVGTSLALVQGSKVGFPSDPVLIVTSCLANGSSGATKRATLYFLNPGSVADPGPGTPTIVKTIQTKIGSSVTGPGNGWAELVLAPDKGWLYGCGTDGSLYTIDYVLDSLQATPVADGTATAVTTKPSALTSCAGLAWDPSNKTIYESTTSTIFHFDPATGSPPSGSPLSFSAPCTVSGLSVVGGVLMVACSGTATVYRLDKSSGALLPDHATIASKGSTVSDLECDPVSFSGNGFSAKRNVDAVWSKIAVTQQAQAFWVPPATCGLPPTETVFAPAACPDLPPAGSPYAAYRNSDGSPIDSDGDGLWNCWKDATLWLADADGIKRPGIDFDGDGIRDFELCAQDAVTNTLECATPGVRDLFVEMDYMQFHKPDPIALSNVKSAFLSAPVDQPNGIHLHVLVDEQIPHNNLVALVPCTAPATATNMAADFDTIKLSNFGTAVERGNGDPHTISAKRFGFRYMLFSHNLVSPSSSGTGNTASGCSEVPGDDSVISLGSFAADPVTAHVGVGTTDQLAGTVMHELGHNLGLRHGGGDNLNCKPNYLSVMSYSRQFTDLITGRRLDYSRDELPVPGTPLNEASLSEDLGIGVPSVTLAPLSQTEKTVFSAVGTFATTVKVVSVNPVSLSPLLPAPIDWNNNGAAGGTVSNVDINKLTGSGCNGNDGTGSQIESLPGFNDWAKLQFNARASLDFAGGVHTDDVHPTAPDKSSDQEEASFAADFDGDGVSDPFACGVDILAAQFQPDPLYPQPTPCAIDIKPGSRPAQLSKSTTSNIAVAILSTPSFNAPTEVVNTFNLKLNDQQVVLNHNGEGTCSVRDVNGDGLKDLICQFPAAGLALGGNFAILEGQVLTPQCGNPGVPCSFRARDFVIVTK
jgi:hypothetical protein